MRSKEKEWNLVSVGNPVAHMMSCSCILDILGICVLETVKFLSLMFSSGVVARCILSFFELDFDTLLLSLELYCRNH